ncbi:hypothetical protein F4806DRAFT_93918 [Annulohypoxylon nitens]|nr:hypothetical protein F4806DRAFT_93918 [Annulohypoxylon nitens]
MTTFAVHQVASYRDLRTEEIHSKMCQYVTHLRACYVCGHEETVLISEQCCQSASKRGAFGSCGSGVDSLAHRTKYQCWRCKEMTKITPRI